MQTLNASVNNTIQLPAGKVLTITGSAQSDGVAYRLNQALGGTNSLQSWAIASGVTQIGPYADDELFLVTCAKGSIDLTVEAFIGGGAGGGATEFTQLTDAPPAILPIGIIAGNADGTALVSLDWTTVDTSSHTLNVYPPNPDPYYFGAHISVQGNADQTVRANIGADAAASYLNLSADIHGLDLIAGPNETTMQLHGGVFKMVDFDVAASDASAHMTVDGVEYSIAKAVKVKIGSDTFFWPLFGPV